MLRLQHRADGRNLGGLIGNEMNEHINANSKLTEFGPSLRLKQ
jgi:hypothetical protein